MELTQDELKENLSYNQETGIFTWIKSYRNQHIGKRVGSHDPDGYLQIKLKRKLHRAHRLAWLYVYGKHPDGPLDHMDGIRDNNAIGNLREVTYAGNSQNQRHAHKDSKSGLIGVHKVSNRNLFRAAIQIQGKRKVLGFFKTAEEGFTAYLEAKREYHSTCTI